MNSGIYQIRNLINSHIYIGSSCDLNLRQKDHFRHLRYGTHHNKYLQNAYNKYGEDQFVFEILEYCDKNELIIREQWYIDSWNPEYNLCPTAASPLGFKHSDETKNLLRELKLGLPSFFKGKKHTTETKNRMSENHANVSGDKNPMFGKHLSNKSKEKLSKSRIGRFIGKDHPNSKSVLQIDSKTNEILYQFESINLASKETNISGGHITLVCQGKRKHAGGYKWKYA